MSAIHIDLESPDLKDVAHLCNVDSYIDIYYGHNDIFEHGWSETSREDEIEIVDSSEYDSFNDPFAFFDDPYDDFDERRLSIQFADVHTAIDILKKYINEESVVLDEYEEKDIASINGDEMKTLCKLIMIFYKNFNLTDECPTVKLKEIFESNNYDCGWAESFIL